MIINPYLVQPSGPSYGALTTAWIAATGETDTTILGALNTLETDLTTYGLTAKMTALYPMVGGTAGKHKFNFMDARDLDAAYRLVFSGGWTHSSTGALPNGTNGTADTYIDIKDSLGIFNYLSSHISFYSRTNTNDSVYRNDMSAVESLYLSAGYQYPTFPGIISNLSVSGYNGVISNADTRGYYLHSRTSNTVSKVFKNSTILRTDTRTSIPYASNVTIKLSYPTEYSNREFAFVSVGTGLSDTEAANFYTAVQAFQTTLSRQV
jgi:hypothetical protein